MKFIEAFVQPESGLQNPANLKETRVLIHTSALLALQSEENDQYLVILKPEYLSTLQSDLFGHGARIKSIRTTIGKDALATLV